MSIDYGNCPACLEACEPQKGDLCVYLNCPACDKLCYHKHCADTWLKRCGWRAGRSAQQGMGAFPCPRGQLLDQPTKACGSRIEYVTPVYAKKKAVVLPPPPVSRGPKAKAAAAAAAAAAAPAQTQAKTVAAAVRAAAARRPEPAFVRGEAIEFKPPPTLGTMTMNDFIPGLEAMPKAARKKRGGAAAAGAKPSAWGGSPPSALQLQGEAMPEDPTPAEQAAALLVRTSSGGSGEQPPQPGASPARANNWVTDVSYYNRLLAALPAGTDADGDSIDEWGTDTYNSHVNSPHEHAPAAAPDSEEWDIKRTAEAVGAMAHEVRSLLTALALPDPDQRRAVEQLPPVQAAAVAREACASWLLSDAGHEATRSALVALPMEQLETMCSLPFEAAREAELQVLAEFLLSPQGRYITDGASPPAAVAPLPPPVPTPVAVVATWQQQQWVAPPSQQWAPAPVVTVDAPRYDQQLMPQQCWQAASLNVGCGAAAVDDERDQELEDELLALCLAN
ncbi:hypothetical protein FOA52_006247 [Chlamydomonas sp. UWO 241]|nr:hypothetical protein FOA52_006247 [Chlamydomonas sp. UWO 241]